MTDGQLNPRPNGECRGPRPGLMPGGRPGIQFVRGLNLTQHATRLQVAPEQAPLSSRRPRTLPRKLLILIRESRVLRAQDHRCVFRGGHGN